jgi:polyisoprenoid-binding protein YceI
MTSVNETPTAVADYVGPWTLDPTQTSVEFRTKAMWVLPVKGNFKAVAGKGAVDEQGGVTGELTLDATTIATGNKKRDAHLKTADFLETVKYPELAFELTDARPDADGHFTLEGRLTIHGQTNPIELHATVGRSGTHHVDVMAEGELDRSQWGLTWAKMGANLHNKIIVKARFTRR